MERRIRSSWNWHQVLLLVHLHHGLANWHPLRHRTIHRHRRIHVPLLFAKRPWHSLKCWNWTRKSLRLTSLHVWRRTLIRKTWRIWMGWLWAMTRGSTRIESGPKVHRVLGIIMKLARMRSLGFILSHFSSKARDFLTHVARQGVNGVARGHPHVPQAATLGWTLDQGSIKSPWTLAWWPIRGFWRTEALLWCAHPFKRTGMPAQGASSLKRVIMKFFMVWTS